MASLHMDPISAPSLASGTSHYASRSSFSCHGIPPLPPDFSLQGRLVGGEDGARMGPSGGEKVDSEGHINDNKISFPSASPNSVRSIRWSGGAVHEVPPRSEVAFVHSPGAVVPFCRPCPSIPCMLVETVAALAAAAAAFARRTHLLAGCESASTPVLANRLRIPRRWAWILESLRTSSLLLRHILPLGRCRRGCLLLRVTGHARVRHVHGPRRALYAMYADADGVGRHGDLI